MHDERSAAVVGGGLAGLAAAWRLARAGVRVRVFEAGPRAGGVIGSVRGGGFLAELGANSLAEPSPAVRALFREAGLEPRLLPTNAEARRRYVVRGGRPLAVPTSPPGLLATRLLSLRAKLRVLAEPLAGPSREADESVSEMVRRRLGREVLDYLVEPFVAGIYAGDPDRLSARSAFPRLVGLEDEHGSLLRGAKAASRARRAAGGSRDPSIYSFAEGMEELPRALAAGLGGAVSVATAVRAVRQMPGGWAVETDASEETFGAVVLAVPAHALGAMEIEGMDAADAEALAAIPHAPVAVLVQGFRREDVAHPLDGFGMLIPRVERRRIMGVLFTSTMFPGRAPEGHVSLTTFVGGTRAPEMAALPPNRLASVVGGELRALLGVRGDPVFSHHHHWTRAIPQYVLGHGQAQRRMDAVERACPGVFLAGSYRSGVSVGDTLASGLKSADAALAHLRVPAAAVPA
ncbi:MAG TPA: protoporphyrinogen oxidase [Longimicrobium sp.]|nr:protoporphyrinogen oxidase [Longimicrobium sp.]